MGESNLSVEMQSVHSEALADLARMITFKSKNVSKFYMLSDVIHLCFFLCKARWWAFILWVWVWMWVSASQRIPLSVLPREIPYETGREQGKARSQSNKLIEVSDGQREREVAAETMSWDLWTQKPGQQVQEYESAFLVAVWKFRSGTRSQ